MARTFAYSRPFAQDSNQALRRCFCPPPPSGSDIPVWLNGLVGAKDASRWITLDGRRLLPRLRPTALNALAWDQIELQTVQLAVVGQYAAIATQPARNDAMAILASYAYRVEGKPLTEIHREAGYSEQSMVLNRSKPAERFIRRGDQLIYAAGGWPHAAFPADMTIAITWSWWEDPCVERAIRSWCASAEHPRRVSLADPPPAASASAAAGSGAPASADM